jgi:hypothetical protein
VKHRSGANHYGSQERSLEFAAVAANKARHSLGNRSKIDTDYATRRFNGSSAGLKKPVGLNFRWKAALPDLQIQLQPLVSRSEVTLGRRLVRMAPGLARSGNSCDPATFSQTEKTAHEKETRL